ncbi:MAG TPA: cobalamin-independent methionine synthase II family protein [Candidatus Binataceae bacterium]|nr:cobalamin-independent methionine synthase II family protein [Candidatus Binataceae bacterium]
MKRSSERILTTHTGSLPRPDALVPLLKAKEAGELADRAGFERSVTAAVAETVRKQSAAGIDIVNDGEMSKVGYSTYVTDRLTGFESAVPSFMLRVADVADFPAFERRWAEDRSLTTLKRPCCTGAIKYRGEAELATDLANLKAALSGAKVEEAFMTAASPGVVSMFLENRHYPTHEAFIGAVADAMKTEYEAIHRAGFVLQLDCPDLAMGYHVRYSEKSVAEFRKIAQIHIEAINAATAGIPADRVRMHLCWANYHGPHHRDIPLKDIIDMILKAHPQAVSYVAANPRHEHEFEVFRDVKLPAGKLLIPGVIDSTSNFIEHPELIAMRICNLARIVGRENVIAGSDCGFGTFAGSETVDSEIVWRKLAAMAEGAQIATQRLW